MPMHDFTDVTYEVQDGLDWITINRITVFNEKRSPDFSAYRGN